MHAFGLVEEMRVSVKAIFGAMLMGFAFVGSASADLRIEEPWVRATVPHQKATGAFMRLVADEAARLVSVSSPVAGKSEIHEMVMEGEVMKMRPIKALDLSAGAVVELKPGGYHLMLLDLKEQVSVGQHVPLVLTIERGGRRETLEVSASVRQIVHIHGH